MRLRLLLALAVLGSGVSASAVFGQAEAPQFADWTSLSNGNTVLSGTLLGQSITMTGGAFHPSGPLDGSSSIFSVPAFSPPLPRSDAPELFGTNPASTYTLAFGAGVRNPIVHLHSLASTLTFAAGTRITKLSGDPQLVVSGNTVSSPPDHDGSVQLAGDYESLSFTALWTGSSQPDGIDVAVGGIAVPPVVTPSPSPSRRRRPRRQRRPRPQRRRRPSRQRWFLRRSPASASWRSSLPGRCSCGCPAGRRSRRCKARRRCRSVPSSMRATGA